MLVDEKIFVCDYEVMCLVFEDSVEVVVEISFVENFYCFVMNLVDEV